MAVSTINMLATLFIAFRILHGLFYLTAWHWLRSLAWLGGFVCVAWLMVAAATRIA